MKITIYDTELNDFSRKYLVKNSSVADPSPVEFMAKAKSIEANLFESLLLFDTISFKVYGEEYPSCYFFESF